MRSLLITISLLLLAAPASAQEAPTSYAIVVGSNAAGAGQEDLRFAESDARRVADVLRDLGGYPTDHITTVLAPTPDSLLAAIDQLAGHLKDDAAAGRQTQVFFYYSGHARASALVLGQEELALTDLRARLTALPATLTIVVLDACQSGAFTRVKGAEKTADFSYNSTENLDASGIAVMASSSESELSQESDFLEGSYFTHHLLVGLRGGGDDNRDGRVSLDEAYQYAYHQTLIATSQTAVGGQHVSLEVDLQGQGEVPLTYPEKATATLTLADVIAGDVLVERLPANAVLAEVHKEAGARFDIAVPPGKYRVLVREAKVVERCPVTVTDHGSATVDLTGCDEMPLIDGGGTKGVHAHPWSLSFGLGVAAPVHDAFTNRLEDSFDYHSEGARGAFSIEGEHELYPHLEAQLRLTHLSGETWKRDISDFMPLAFQVASDAVTAGARGSIGDGHLRGWAEAGAGATWSRARFTDEEGATSNDSHLGAHLEAAAGFTWFPFQHTIGVDLDARWLYAPTVKNLIDDEMNVGGFFVGLGLTYRFTP